MIERSLAFGEHDGLIGTLCLPDAGVNGGAVASAGIILFNAGIVHRIGPHRINVTLARTLAAAGIASLRFDLAGLGDSARARGDNGFEAQAVSDLQAAMTTLGSATGLTQFGLFGFCSGAFHSYNTALADDRVTGVLIFDAYRYATWKSHLIRWSLRLRQHGVLRSGALLLGKLWTRLTGRRQSHGITNAAVPASSSAYIAEPTAKAPFARGMKQLLDRGVDIAMVFAGDGLEIYNYRQQFSDAFRRYRIADRIDIRFLPDIDHVATGRAAQAELIAAILPWTQRVARITAVETVQNLPAPSQGDVSKPDVIVLSRTVTGLETVRCLAKAGIRVHAIYFEKNDPVQFSRYCRAIYCDPAHQDDQHLLDFLITIAKDLGHRPIVVPTCDAHALLLARWRALLARSCQVMGASYAALSNVVNKDELHRETERAGLATIPTLVAPDVAAATTWSAIHPPPYLVKPFYAGVATARMTQKNRVVETRDALLAFLGSGTNESLIVQRLIRGGDGYIFDCYGYCNRQGQIVAMASKRRLHQHLPDYGTCSMGQIPASIEGHPEIEATIFADTRRLFQTVDYHGIFGVEWLLERDTGRIYLIDFNARPFMSIGHVAAAGLNLPALAYADMTGEDLSATDQTPRLKQLLGVNVLRDLESLQVRRANGTMRIAHWFRMVLRCRYFYYTDWRDPGPALARAREIFQHAVRYLTPWNKAVKATKSAEPADPAASAMR